MKKLLRILTLAICLPLFVSAKPKESQDTETYTIYKIYEKIELDNGSKVIDSWGNIEDTKAVLVPTEIDRGRYSVEIRHRPVFCVNENYRISNILNL